MTDIRIDPVQRIVDLSNGKLSRENAGQIYRAANALMMIATDASPDRIKMSIGMRAEAVLTAAELDAIHGFIAGDEPPYGAGDGTPDNPVVINRGTTMHGVAAEYAYLSKRFGEQHKDWTCELQAVGERGKKTIDVLVIKPVNGPEQAIHFDISRFYGK